MCPNRLHISAPFRNVLCRIGEQHLGHGTKSIQQAAGYYQNIPAFHMHNVVSDVHIEDKAYNVVSFIRVDLKRLPRVSIIEKP